MGRSRVKSTWFIPGVRPGAYATMKIRIENRRDNPDARLTPNARVTSYREAV